MIDYPKYYSYIFLKPGLIPEQMAIQVGHVSMKAATEFRMSTGFDPDKLNFVMVPFIDFRADKTMNALDDMKINWVRFIDHLYEFEEGVLKEFLTQCTTAVMTEPIEDGFQGILKYLPLYRVKAKTEFVCG